MLTKLSSFFSVSKAFVALTNPAARKEVQSKRNKKVEALSKVIMSLTNEELQYLNILQTEKKIEENQSVLTNKMISEQGQQIQPIQHFYQKHFTRKNWKESNLLSFVTSADNEEDGDKEEVAVVKQSYDVELTSLDAAQKIKIIKILRETFSLGLKQAKEFADKAPIILKKNVKTEEAEKLKKNLDEAGCVITLK